MTSMRGWDCRARLVEDQYLAGVKAEQAPGCYPWEDPANQYDPPVEFTAPLWRCTYCGVSDHAVTTCPSCGGPRHWR